jgi:hypothetical protein
MRNELFQFIPTLSMAKGRDLRWHGDGLRNGTIDVVQRRMRTASLSHQRSLAPLGINFTLPVALLLISSGLLLAQEPARAPVPLWLPIQDKNFYLLSLFERTEPVRLALQADEGLRRTRDLKLDALKNAIQCQPELTCYTEALMWKKEEIAAVEQSLRMLYRNSPPLRNMVSGPMRASGMFQLRGNLTDEELLAWAWTDAAQGVNRAIAVYGEGAAPRYPEIDSVAYDVKSESFKRLVHVILSGMLDEADTYSLFFHPSLRFGLRLMEASKRDETGRLEPLELGENRDALKRVKSIRWSEYPYSAIVVPGSGTDRLTWDLSPWGKERMRLAARRYREKKAPFLIVSGGFVHPNQTPYAEAMEMKKVLISEFGIPADAVIVEPHARHTTTNIRNAARLIWRYGLPFDKLALITTDIYQSRTIESEEFRQRCQRELGYQPYELRSRKSEFDLEFLPRLDSLHADSTDLLDP